jgi:hypothetical protein
MMEEIQKKYGQKAQVLLVTKDSKERIDKLFAISPIAKNTRLPIIYADSLLSKLFYYASVPTHVWIGPDRRLIEKTSGSNTTPEIVATWLAGKSVHLFPKREFSNFEKGMPLFLEGQGRQTKHLQYYSIIANHLDGLDGLDDIRIEKDSGKITRILLTNKPILDLFRMAFTKNQQVLSFVYLNNRTLLEVPDPGKFFFPSSPQNLSEWKSKNLYSYEIKVPTSKSGMIFQIMLNDLEKYFNVRPSIQKRKIKCLVLSLTDSNLLKTQGGVPTWKVKDDGRSTIIRNQAFARFISYLTDNNLLLTTPVVDETNFNGNFDMHLDHKIDDLTNLPRELKKFGLALKEEEREIEMFVLSSSYDK